MKNHEPGQTGLPPNPYAASKIGMFRNYSRTNQSWEEVFDGEYDCQLLTPPTTVLDIGANEGAFSAWASEKWPTAKIEAYEPVAENSELFRKNLSGNPNIFLFESAVSDFDGHLRLYGPLHNSGEWSFFDLGEQNFYQTVHVPVIAANRIASSEFVKIDCEGCELLILKKLDLSATKALVVEYHQGHYREEIIKICTAAGLNLFHAFAWTGKTGVLKFARAGARIPSAEPVHIPDDMRFSGTSADGRLVSLTAGNLRNEHYDSRLAGMKLFVGCPVGHLNLHFMRSLMQLQTEKPLPMEVHFSTGDGVARARNALTATFLRGDCTHLLWLDDDLIFGRHHIVSLLLADKPIVGGFYPKKQEGALEWVVNSLPENPGPVGNLQPVKYAGTGFLLIKREVFEKMMLEYPELAFCEDYGSRQMAYDFWSMGVYRDGIGNALAAAAILRRYFKMAKELPPSTEEFMAAVNGLADELPAAAVGRYLSEDWFFCQRWLDMGGTVFNHCNVILKHVGQAIYPLKTQEPEISRPRPPQSSAPTADHAEMPPANVIDGEMVPGVRNKPLAASA